MIAINVAVFLAIGSFPLGVVWANFVFTGYYRKVLERNIEACRKQYQELLDRRSHHDY